jgi:hypothetical protein
MKRLLTAAMAAALLASLTACGSAANAANSNVIYGQIDSVSGNDLVLLLAEYNENADSGDADAAADSDSEKRSGETKRERPENFDPSDMPEGFDFSNMPEGFEKPADGNFPGGFEPSKSGGSRSVSVGNSRYTLTGEQEELRVPVGTTVTTALGVETDFEVLSTGDMIRCSVEKDSDGNDVITAIWILEE